MTDSYLIRTEKCPLCVSEGNDRNEDNLAVYSDGHSYCYAGHGVVHRGSQIIQFKNKDLPHAGSREELLLPVDCDITYPEQCLEWVGKYELDRNDLLTNNVMWSESWKRLIFPVYDEFGIAAWQGRYFGEDKTKAKWFGRGDLKNIYNILGSSGILVLVEDIVSAIKIAKAGFMAMPLYGCVIGTERFKRLFLLFGKQVGVVVWLDEDKHREALKEAKLGALYGMDCRVVFSKRDPKDENFNSIKEILK